MRDEKLTRRVPRPDLAFWRDKTAVVGTLSESAPSARKR
jgi:hypothetical protein